MDFRDVWPIIEDAPTVAEHEGSRIDIDDWRVGEGECSCTNHPSDFGAESAGEI